MSSQVSARDDGNSVSRMFALRNRELWSGLLFIAFGCFALVAGRDYEMGTAMQMRAGYLPTLLAWLLCGVGVVVVLRGFVAQHTSAVSIRTHAARSFLILLAVVTFALLLERAGLVISTVILTGLAGLAGHELRMREIAALALTLTAISVAVFVWGLGLPLRLWPAVVW